MKTNERLKKQAIALRRQGTSIVVIERTLRVARSTLSGWLKDVPLTSVQREKLTQGSLSGLTKARAASIKVKRDQKRERIQLAANEARQTLQQIPESANTLELALAMLYWGEGAKSGGMSLGNSDPVLLRFFITAIWHCYDVPKEKIRCQLHLRMDQDAKELTEYWAATLGLPVTAFMPALYDKRTANKPTYPHYKGVCQVYYGSIALQRRLSFVYTYYCSQTLSRLGA